MILLNGYLWLIKHKVNVYFDFIFFQIFLFEKHQTLALQCLTKEVFVIGGV